MLIARGGGWIRSGQRRRSHDERSLPLALLARFAAHHFIGGPNSRAWMRGDRVMTMHLGGISDIARSVDGGGAVDGNTVVPPRT